MWLELITRDGWNRSARVWDHDTTSEGCSMIYTEEDGDLSALDGQVAVVGYGNQGRSWALNLRDSSCDPLVCVRHDASRELAEADGFTAAELDAASGADVIC